MAIGNSAHLLYGQGQTSGLPMEAIPRNKFSFTVSLNTIDGTVDLRRIANIQMPSFVYRTQTLNNYNNKSIVQTGIDYTPISLTAYDTKDAVFENFLKDYAEHYFAGPMNEEDYQAFLTDPKGLQLRDNKNYITMMTITRVDSFMHNNVIEIFHPFITNADADTLDYSDSSPSTFRVSFAYEGYNIVSGFKKSSKPAHINGVAESAQVLEGDMGAGYYKNQHAVANPNGPPGSVYSSNKPEFYGYHPVGMATGSSWQSAGGMTSETGSSFQTGGGMTSETGSSFQTGGGMTSETGSNYHVGDGSGFAARQNDTMEATDGSGYANMGKVLKKGETLTEIDGKKYVKSAAIEKPTVSGKTGAQ